MKKVADRSEEIVIILDKNNRPRCLTKFDIDEDSFAKLTKFYILGEKLIVY